MTASDETAYLRAFVAVSTLVDNRGAAIADAPPLVRALCLELESGDRRTRAAALARELVRVAAALDARRIT